MKSVTATMSINLITTCPHCNFYFDLMSESNLNDDGWLIRQLIPDDNSCWIDHHKNFDVVVTCPECNNHFNVNSIFW